MAPSTTSGPGSSGPLISATAATAAEVLVTLGPGVEAATLGEVPANVRVESYLPLSAVLPHCDVVVGHAGWNTVVGAALAGVPMVALVIGADHAHNAAAAVSTGWAEAIHDELPAAEEVAAAVHRCLTEPGLRGAARQQRARLLEQPTADAVAALLVTRFGTAV